MIKNYLLTSIRNLRKHFVYSVINITGLGLGLAICLLLVVWISHELSYDKFYEKSDRIYRAALEYSFGGQVVKTSVSPTALLPSLEKNFAEVETGVRVYNPSAWRSYIVRYEDNVFEEGDFYFADSTFFDVFSVKLLSGDARTVLKEPYTAIVTKSTSKKYFGDEDPVGKTLVVNDRDYTITGLVDDLPGNSVLQFDLLGSFHSLRAGREEPIWWSANYQTFVVLDGNANIDSLTRKGNDLIKKELASELTGEGDYVKYNYTKLSDIHLYSDVEEPVVVGDIKYVYIFSGIALLILLIACINYVNLATARAVDRAKEVGVRKVVGALRNQLLVQFIGESLVITFLSLALALLLARFALPFFNDLSGKALNMSQLLTPEFLFYYFAGMITIALLAGAYPAFAITAFKPVQVLKGNFRSSGRGVWLRRVLVTAQFSISMVLIIGTLVIYNQLQFIQQKKLGYDRNNVIVMPYDGKTAESFRTLRDELKRTGVVAEVGRGSESPANIKGGYTVRAEGSDRDIGITGLTADENYVASMGMEILLGRDFTEADRKRMEEDTVYSFIVNEAALAALFIQPDEAIGKRISVHPREGEIIGVVKDFHFSSLHNNIGPLVIFPEYQQFNHIFVKINSHEVPDALTKIKTVYTTLLPHRPFEFEFLDQQYQALYSEEQRMGTVFIVFASLAIVIACLGLLGLVAFSAAQKTKEIGIRKVLGATEASIVMLITREFVKLVLVAIVVGIPVAYYIMQAWLSDFAYRVDIGVANLALASLVCVVIAFGTASFQAIKAAFINPAHTLRNE